MYLKSNIFTQNCQVMNFTLGLVTFFLSVLIAFSAAKGFWSAPFQKQGGDSDEVVFEEVGINSVTPTPTSTTTTTTATTTTGPCINGCIPPTIGTTNGPTAPPPFNTNYNGRDPFIVSYPTTQP